MVELPEALVLAKQINEVVKGRRIAGVVPNASPHGFAWFNGDPAAYPQMLIGRTIGNADAFGCLVHVEADDMALYFSTNMSFHEKGAKRPKKHQLMLEFEDGSALTCSVQMWGCMLCCPKGRESEMKSGYSINRPIAPLSDEFTYEHFKSLAPEDGKISAKALLATDQRIPGLGNGVAQDILYTARINPKRKLRDLSEEQLRGLYDATVSVIRQMVEKGGRDTERDLLGNKGGYETMLSKLTVDRPCRFCSSAIIKEAYLGGSVYYCPKCQPAPNAK